QLRLCLFRGRTPGPSRKTLRTALVFEPETLVPLACDLLAALTVGGEAAEIDRELPGLAGNVGAHVPGVGGGVEGVSGDFRRMGDPLVLGLFVGLDDRQAPLAHVVKAAGDPV